MNPDSPMGPDKYQQAWKLHSSETRVTVDAELLLNEVQRNQRRFRTTIFCRDFREVAVALVMIPVWFYLGARVSPPWTWYLTVPVLIWIAAFMLVYRLRHKRRLTESDAPLLQCVKLAVTEVDDQIWLLRNVFWWYLLPPGISIAIFFAHFTWLRSKSWSDALSHVHVFVVFLAVFGFIYWLNQYVVRKQLEPRRRELLGLLASLGDETTSKGSNPPKPSQLT
jgi:hypothetical protein